MPLENNRNAYIGMNVESLFKNSIVDNSDIVENIRNKYGIEGRLLNVNKIGIVGEKADVRMSFACGHYIDVNIKAYKMGFNQLTRTTISRFCELFDIDDEYKQELTHALINKARNPHNTVLFSDDIKQKWYNFFVSNTKKIIKWGFSYAKSREIIALYSRTDSIFRIYSMGEVLNTISDYVSFSSRGNVDIGQCISFQRKGGNGVSSKAIPKDDIKHPGNNIQLKLKVHNFVKEMNDCLLGQYSI